MVKLKYQPIRNLPVARFYYQGSKSHPIRRTVLVTEANGKFIKGYELRCGSETRTATNAPIRTFCRTKIANFGDLRTDSSDRKRNRKTATTLSRSGLLDLVAVGV